MGFYDAFPYDHAPDERRPGLAGRLIGRLLEEGGNGRRLLDIGCGAGSLAALLSAAGFRVIGLDASVVSVSAARRRGIPALCGDALALPVPDSSVDIVVAFGVLHHISDPHRGFREACRVLKPGGVLHVSVYHPHHPYRWIYETVGRGLQRWSGPRGVRTLRWTVFPFFYAALWVVLCVYQRHAPRLAVSEAWNLFGDQLLTPIAWFIQPEQLSAWAGEGGLTETASGREVLGQMQSYVFTKRQEP